MIGLDGGRCRCMGHTSVVVVVERVKKGSPERDGVG